MKNLDKSDSRMSILISYKNFRPIVADEQRALAGSSPQLFPKVQPLPIDWFQGDKVTLHFHYDPSGYWYVSRQGTPLILILQLWSNQDQPLGSPLRVGTTQARLPTDLSSLAKIEVRHEEDYKL
jgi:hypothetical protein